MSVAIALLTKASAHKTGTQSPLATDASLAGTDFASLLLGQLAANTDLRQDSRLLPSQDSERLTASDEPTNGAASPEDASMLLATLGLATSEQARQLELMQTSSVPVTQELGIAPPALTGSALNLMPSTNTAASSSRSSLPDSATDGGKAAIIAGTDVALPRTDAQLSQTIGSDAKIPVALANDVATTHMQSVDPALLRLAGSTIGSTRTSPFGQTTPGESVAPKASVTDISAANTTALGKIAPIEPALPKAVIAEVSAANTTSLGNTVLTEPAVTIVSTANTTSLGQTGAVDPALPKAAIAEVSAANTISLGKTTPAESMPQRISLTESSPTEITVSDLPVTEIPTSNGQGVVATPAHGSGSSSSQSRLEVATPLRDPAWASDFSQKVVWLASNDKQSAQITLNPPDMGPIEISLNLSKDGASAFFVSPNAEVRETIEAALPRLKEMLADVGIQLGQSNVGSESSRQQMENQEARQGSPRWRADNAILGADLPGTLPGQAVTAQGMNGLVNTFA